MDRPADMVAGVKPDELDAADRRSVRLSISRTPKRGVVSARVLPPMSGLIAVLQVTHSGHMHGSMPVSTRLVLRRRFAS